MEERIVSGWLGAEPACFDLWAPLQSLVAASGGWGGWPLPVPGTHHFLVRFLVVTLGNCMDSWSLGKKVNHEAHTSSGPGQDAGYKALTLESPAQPPQLQLWAFGCSLPGVT